MTTVMTMKIIINDSKNDILEHNSFEEHNIKPSFLHRQLIVCLGLTLPEQLVSEVYRSELHHLR